MADADRLSAGFGLDIRLTILAGPFRLGAFRNRPPAHVWVVADESGVPIMVAAPGPQSLYPVREGHRVFPWRRKRRRSNAVRVFLTGALIVAEDSLREAPRRQA